MNWIDRIAKQLSVIAAPALERARLFRPLSAVNDYLAFLGGQGSGSGWDVSGEAKAAAKLLSRPAAVILDVGANDGRWSAALAAEMGSPDLQFFLFECSPYVLPYTARQLPSIPNARLFEVAVSSACGRVALHTPKHGSGLASLHARRDVGIQKEVYETVTVDAITIDSFVGEHAIDRVDLLKLDVEGHELAVLQGASSAISNGIIRALVFEFGSANVNSRTYFRDFWDVLADRYSISRIGPGGVLIPVAAYSERLEYFRGVTNYAASLRP